MSAPKTKAGRRRALAKEQDTRRLRTLSELKEEAGRVAKMFRRSSAGREDIEAVGRLILSAAWTLTRWGMDRDDREELDRLDAASRTSAAAPSGPIRRARR